MDLKEMVLSAIADLENSESKDILPSDLMQEVENEKPETVQKVAEKHEISSGELEFLASMKERLLVIFEGLQSPNNQSNAAKVDLVLNFLEYLLVVAEERIEAVKSRGAD